LILLVNYLMQSGSETGLAIRSEKVWRFYSFSVPVARRRRPKRQPGLMGDPKISDVIQSYFVYVLGSSNANGVRTYVGCTTDMERRLAEHNAGAGARSTRGRQWRIIYAERAGDRSSAQSREWRLKRDRAFRKSLAKHIPGIV